MPVMGPGCAGLSCTFTGKVAAGEVPQELVTVTETDEGFAAPAAAVAATEFVVEVAGVQLLGNVHA